MRALQGRMPSVDLMFHRGETRETGASRGAVSVAAARSVGAKLDRQTTLAGGAKQSRCLARFGPLGHHEERRLPDGKERRNVSQTTAGVPLCQRKLRKWFHRPEGSTLAELQQHIDDLKRRIHDLGGLVEQAISQAIAALGRYDTMLAKATIAADEKIDLLEIEVEEQCLAILTDHHLDSADLRFVVAVLKINNDLERVGDLAVNIAKTVLQLVDNERFQQVGGCRSMATEAEAMLRDSLQALINRDVRLARKVINADDEVDDWQRRIQRSIEKAIDRTPENVTTLMQLDFVVRQLERVGDMATNIAEDVIYMVEGKIVRHQSLRGRSGGPSAGRIF